jgi:flagellar M-ring protein FliF
MFDAAYWRAKEGELARTISSAAAVQYARVHIANPGGKPFQRDVPTTASVTVTPSGGGLGMEKARALRYLVASAVSGLKPEDVSIIDANGGMILGGDEPGALPFGGDRAAELKRNVERLLEARVGYGNAVVEVNVETITDREQITERIVDPESRVAISEDTTETANTASDTGGTGVTVASNLPDGDAAGGKDTSQSEGSETRARVNYEISATQREILRTPGGIARITTAVLIDGLRSTAADGTVTWEPRTDAEMDGLRALVASAVGFSEARGDALTLMSMQFEPVPTIGSDGAGGLPFPVNIDAMRLAQMAILGVVALLIGLFVVRPVLTRPAIPAIAPPNGTNAGVGALTGEIDTGEMPGHAMQIVSGRNAAADAAPDPVARLRALIDERQAESMEVLKSWMEDDVEKA